MRDWKPSPLRFSLPEGMRKKRFWIEWDPIEKFNGLLAFFTFLLVLVGLLQAWSFIQSERAFVYLGALRFESGKIAPKTPILIDAQIKNGGRSTARVKVNFSLRTFESLPKKPEYSKHENASFLSLTSNDTRSINITAQFQDGRIMYPDPKLVDQINAGSMGLYVYGYIRYNDDFSFLLGSRTTGFCLKYDPSSNPSEGNFDDCDEANYSY